MNKGPFLFALLLPGAVIPAAARPSGPFAKQPGVMEAAAKRKAWLEEMRKDPLRMELYRLREALRTAKGAAEKETLRLRIYELTVKQAAEAEARLTPEQKAERAERRRKKEAERAELAPLLARLKAAGTPEERAAVMALIKEVRSRYD